MFCKHLSNYFLLFLLTVPSQDTTPSKGTTTQDAVSEQNGEGKGKMSTLKVTENTSSVSAINSQFLNDEKQEEKSQNVEVEEKPVIEETHSADCIQATVRSSVFPCCQLI